MKRTAVILLMLAALSVSAAKVWPDGQAQERIEATASQPATAAGEQGRIVLSAGTADAVFSVYSITGQLMRTVKVPAGTSVTVDVPRGFYVVKHVGHWSRKVIVK